MFDGTTAEPRPYQLRIAEKTVGFFKGEGLDRVANSVMIESPTGSGKTVIGLAIARYMQRTYGYSVGWVAMRRNLLAQAQAENLARGFNVDMRVVSMFDRNPPAVDMLVVDEAQHDAASTMANLHCTVKPKKVLGLTATPYRTDRVKLCFDKVITDAGIHQLIQDGYLSRYRHFTIPDYTPESVARFYVAEPSRWGKSLVFFHRLEDCLNCLQRLEDAGIVCDVVTASTNRERQLKAFERGGIQVLLNMMVLTEGFDCPSLQTVFCRPSGRGPTTQMCGRVFRKYPELPMKQIVQCSRAAHPFIRTAMADEQYIWSDTAGWQSLKVNEQLESITQAARMAVASARVEELPKIIRQHRTRRTPWGREE